ncbi:hypothetical protein OUZ56_012059 [Daphnia magna]|uniref:Uncharacterized protein n=1 Tax=Daphnia magna TaxID=35525 RepID=A0ABQ9Z1W9_9CRUS|nr:hypothetical protein OUZ56_012059 [Daphnia magna]
MFVCDTSAKEGRRGDGHIGQGWVLRFKASNHHNSSPYLESNTDLQHHLQKCYTYAIDNDTYPTLPCRVHHPVYPAP